MKERRGTMGKRTMGHARPAKLHAPAAHFDETLGASGGIDALNESRR